MRRQRLIDITEPLRDGLPVWPGDPVVRLRDASPGGPFRVSELRLSTHAGTHVDPPAHWRGLRRTIEKVALSKLVGPATVVRVRERRVIEPRSLESALASSPR